MKPLGTNVLIKIAEAKKTSDSGKVLLTSATKKPLQGEVVAVAEGTEDYKMKLKVGDTVMYHDNQGHKLDYLGKPHLLILEQSCLAIL